MMARFQGIVAALALGAGLLLAAPAAGQALCASDAQCDDGLFCNGAERCAPGRAGANSRGCMRAAPPCRAPQVCFEDRNQCRTPCRDADGDGHEDMRCGGDDCDDRDADRYPGNVEVCDAARHDEDCDPSTYGHRDLDRDGVADARCCNVRPDGGANCGSDCDDANRAIQPSAQVCDATGVAICEGGTFRRAACPSGTSCVPQPNGTGVCTTQPPAYTPPPRFTPPRPSTLPNPSGRPTTRRRYSPTRRTPVFRR